MPSVSIKPSSFVLFPLCESIVHRRLRPVKHSFDPTVNETTRDKCCKQLGATPKHNILLMNNLSVCVVADITVFAQSLWDTPLACLWFGPPLLCDHLLQLMQAWLHKKPHLAASHQALACTSCFQMLEVLLLQSAQAKILSLSWPNLPISVDHNIAPLLRSHPLPPWGTTKHLVSVVSSTLVQRKY